MSVDYEHSQYKDILVDWDLLGDLYAGEKAIKASGTRYLPQLLGQDSDEYTAYKTRGEFFNALARTVQGLTGSVFRRKPEVIIPEDMKPLLENITSTGKSIFNLSKDVVLESLKYGRCGLLSDKDGTEGEPYISFYGPKNIINWATTLINGKEILSLLVLKEQVSELDDFEPVIMEQIRVLRLEDGVCSVEVYIKGEDDDEYALVDDPIELQIQGKRIDYIPFSFIGTEDNEPKPNKPPLLDLGYINISHWRKSVDLAHGLHFAALPTPWAAGFDSREKLFIGPTHAWVSSEPNASCGYLEFSGSGLKSIEEALDRNESQMAALGARLIDKPRDQVETAETARIHQAGETSSLVSIVRTISEGITQALKYVAMWKSLPCEDILFTLNTDFIDTSLTPQQLSALVATLQTGSISQDTFLYQMQIGEILPPGRDIDEEKSLIEAEGNIPFTNEPNSEFVGGGNK